MEDITDAEDPIPSTPSFPSRPSSPCNPETDRVTPSPQDSITESNDTFQIPPPLSPHLFISQSTIDANDLPSNPPSHVYDVPPPPPADINDSQPGPFSDFHNKWSAILQLVTPGKNSPRIVVNLPLILLIPVRIIFIIPKMLLLVVRAAHPLDL